MTSPARSGRSTGRQRIIRGAPCLLALAVLAAAPRATIPQESGARPPAWRSARLLRVCADPDNLPFSNRAQEGFENRLAELVARELGDSLRYVWWPQRRGFVRNTLRAGECDVVLGVPGAFDPVLATRPYYRSTYYLVAPASRTPAIVSLDDPALRRLRVGVHLIGEDYTHTPPVHALLARGISTNVRGFPTYYGEGQGPGDIFDALAAGDIDVAVVWGPLAGFFAARSPVPLSLVPLPDDARSSLPFAFDIAMGVRRGDAELRARLDDILERRRDEVDAILRAFHVPTVAPRAAAPRATRPVDPAGTQPPARPAADSARQAPVAQARRDMLAVTQSEYNGWKTFAVNCTRCHGEDGVGSALAPSLLKSLRESVTHDVFVQTVTEGRLAKGMPVWKELLTTQQIEDLYAYLKARSEARLAPGRPHMRTPR